MDVSGDVLGMFPGYFGDVSGIVRRGFGRWGNACSSMLFCAVGRSVSKVYLRIPSERTIRIVGRMLYKARFSESLPVRHLCA